MNKRVTIKGPADPTPAKPAAPCYVRPMWTRKPCVIGGQAAPDDWLVLWCGQDCGRVHLTYSPINAQRAVWAWTAWCDPAADGRCDTLAEGCDLVRRSVIAAGGRMSGSRGDLVM